MARYVESAEVEARILERIHKLDILGVSRCVKLLDHFTFTHERDRHYALIFEPLGKSLYDVVKVNGYRGKIRSKVPFYRVPYRLCPVICPPALSISRILAQYRTNSH